MAYDGKGGGGGNRNDAIYEQAAKKLEKAAKACRIQKGGVECAVLDIAAAVVKNAPAVADALAGRNSRSALGSLHQRALAAAAEIEVEATPNAPSALKEAVPPTSAEAAVSGATAMEASPAVANAVAEPAQEPVAEEEGPRERS